MVIPSFQTLTSTYVGWFVQSKRTSMKLETLLFQFLLLWDPEVDQSHTIGEV